MSNESLAHSNDQMAIVEFLAKRLTRTIRPKDRMLDLMLKEGLKAVEPYPLSIFGTSEIINDNPGAGTYFKLTIQKKLLFPEFESNFQHVLVDQIEFDCWLLDALDPQKKKRILATIIEWEKQTGMAVRFDGVVGFDTVQFN